MLIKCPTCKREFTEPGFCPYDGAQLFSVDDRETVLSAQHAAESSKPPTDAPDSSPTELERIRTRPLTPSVHGPKSASQAISFSSMRAVSAAQDTDAAIRAMRFPSEYDRMVGETLDGRYFVQRKIGEGGMGVVFAVRHTVIERPLAIKVLKREVMRDAGTIRRFVQEARAASRIGHPNIVDVTDFGKTNEGLTYQVMEFIDGMTLGYAIRTGAPFPLVRVIRIAAQIARALGVAHDKGIVHRDLKPENVFLLDRDGRPDFVKIVDFGIAKVAPLPGTMDQLAPRLTKVGSVFGTPEYMAPEQAQGRGDTDGRVDIYALGTIIYEMMTGQVPHKGDTTVRTLAMQMLDPVVPPSQIRPDLRIEPEAEAMVMKALAKKREDRYQTMGELVNVLEHLTREVLPPPVGQSVTGNPVYALPALPPGADPAAVAQSAGSTSIGVPRAPISEPPKQIEAPPMTNDLAVTRRRVPDEPQFVAQAKPLTFEHVDRDRDRDRTLPPPSHRGGRGLLVFVVLLLVGGGAGATYYFAFRDRGASDDGAANAGGSGSSGSGAAGGNSQPRDAALVATATPDASNAAVPPPTPVDAGAGTVAAAIDAAAATPPADAAVVAVVPVDAGATHPPKPQPVPLHPRHDAGVGRQGPVTMPSGDDEIVVQTSSEAARIYIGTTYRGVNGVTLSEPYGTRETVECRAPGFKNGHVNLVFDGSVGAVFCKMQRVKICINNIKNPFDDCEVDPNRPSPDPSVTP